ncbi:MAG: transcription antitermination factor NusB [Candidatus Hydrogenedentota bacterium]|nr:MAG: transcription antitermination factor NusB [Candidatus Hydrogenedentota bacterium]
MKRHRARIVAMQAVFQTQFHPVPVEDLKQFKWIDFTLPEEEAKMASEILEGTLNHLSEIDRLIKQYSEHWALERISHVTKAVLRTAIYQLLSRYRNVPPAVIIDEAVRIAKKYDEEDAKRFVNGLLDRIHKDFKQGIIQEFQ